MSKNALWMAFGKLWRQYKYRFVPWIVFNVKTGERSKTIVSKPLGVTKTSEKDPFQIHVVSHKNDRLVTDISFLHNLSMLLTEFRNFEMNSTKHYTNEADNYFNNLNIMNKVIGFSVKTGTSRISPEAGLGVFVASGSVKAGSIVALYPGTIYKAYEPLFFPSIKNSFIFRCSDGIHIDGKSKGISKSIYKSCAARDKFHFHLPCCDESWLTPYPLNPLNIGQYVNNKFGTNAHNVVYQECFLPLPSKKIQNNTTLDLPLWKYLPNVWSNPDNNTGLKMIPLIAVRDIKEGEELLSSYFTIVHS